MQYYPFDSRNSLYKSKFGAVAQGENLALRLLLHNDAKVSKAFLLVKKDGENDYIYYEMSLKDYVEDYRVYEYTLSFDEGIYWYKFKYLSDFGEFLVTKGEHNLGLVSNSGTDWQQTVFSGDFKTPDWLKGGIIYQIFPDRFYNSGKDKKNVPTDRHLCDDWYKVPEHRQKNDKLRLCNDYYGGDLKGIKQKLKYLRDLGVNCIYLNPIFEAHSNHRYNTADYLKIDPLLGDENDLRDLIKSAEKHGIYIILDGVFSHTGDDSIYFNKYKRYGERGAFNDRNSKYLSWYKFNNYPNEYSAWWGVPSLPETNEDDDSFTEFITGKNGVLKHWLGLGIKGFRLDVADELPDKFLDNIRASLKEEDSENFLLGEVWEDATNKISYGKRRRFLRGKQLDSVMNYPFANAIIAFLKGGNARDLLDLVLDVLENYPCEAVNLLMNHIGTHDTCRIINVLGCEETDFGDREAQSRRKLSDKEYSLGKSLLKLAATLQYTLPGVPSVYYGDEAGATGFADPFCRGTYPWGREDKELLEFYKKLGAFRRNTKAFTGEFIPLYANFGDIMFIRKNGESEVLVLVNRWIDSVTHEIPERFNNAKAVFGAPPKDNKVTVGAKDICVLEL